MQLLPPAFRPCCCQATLPMPDRTRLAMNRTRSTGITIRRFSPGAGGGIGSSTSGTTPAPSTSIPKPTCIIRGAARCCEAEADRSLRRDPKLNGSRQGVLVKSGMRDGAGDLGVIAEIQERILAEAVQPDAAPGVAITHTHRDHPDMGWITAPGVQRASDDLSHNRHRDRAQGVLLAVLAGEHDLRAVADRRRS